MRTSRRHRLLEALAALVIASITAAGGQSDGPAPAPTEYEVKAAFLYNFARFVEWPPEAQRAEPFVIAVLGRDPFGTALDEAVSGKTVAGRPIQVRRASRVEDVGDAQMVFVAATEGPNVPAILKALERPGVLTVGDAEGFVERGGTINFTLQSRRVRFEINPVRAEQAGLKVSSQLLKLATLVVTPRQ
jgi:uncharacterized protein DUF4154